MKARDWAGNEIGFLGGSPGEISTRARFFGNSLMDQRFTLDGDD